MKKTTATYQVGVDVLGFPIYIEHHIYEVPMEQQNGIRHKPKKQKLTTKIVERQVKQH